MSDVLPDSAQVHVPHGATESLPVASLSSRSIDETLTERTRSSAGLCVGEFAPRTEVWIAAIKAGLLTDWDEAAELGRSQLSERTCQRRGSTACSAPNPAAPFLVTLASALKG